MKTTDQLTGALVGSQQGAAHFPRPLVRNKLELIGSKEGVDPRAGFFRVQPAQIMLVPNDSRFRGAGVPIPVSISIPIGMKLGMRVLTVYCDLWLRNLREQR